MTPASDWSRGGYPRAWPGSHSLQLVDYFVLRRRRLYVRDLFLPPSESRYGYWKGVNVVAFVAVAAGALT